MSSMRSNVARLAVVACVGGLVALPSLAEGAEPTCGGQTATIVGSGYGATIHGTSGDDVIVGTAGPDTIDGGDGNDRICGLAGDDMLDDGTGNDQVFGGTGWDQFIAGDGDDLMIGGPDSEPSTTYNSVSYENSAGPVTVDLQADSATGDGDDLVKHIWTAYGSAYGDTLYGTPAADRLYGGCGNDTLIGRGGNDALFGSYDLGGPVCSSLTSNDDDQIYGGGGSDVFVGEESNDIGGDTLYGGKGDDVFNDHGNGETFSAGPGVDTFNGPTASDNSGGLNIDLGQSRYTVGNHTGLVEDVENVNGTVDDDILRGNDSANRLVGKDGVDRLYGFGGADVLRGDGLRHQDSQWSDVAFGGGGTDNCRAEIKKSCEQ